MSIFNHRWLPSSDRFQLIKSVNNSYLWMVADLVDTKSKKWNLELITFAFE